MVDLLIQCTLYALFKTKTDLLVIKMIRTEVEFHYNWANFNITHLDLNVSYCIQFCQIYLIDKIPNSYHSSLERVIQADHNTKKVKTRNNLLSNSRFYPTLYTPTRSTSRNKYAHVIDASHNSRVYLVQCRPVVHRILLALTAPAIISGAAV